MSIYTYDGFRSYRETEDGRDLMANFVARIDEEVRLVDGQNTETFLVISGEGPSQDDGQEPTKYPPVKIAASAFAGMGWVMSAWGVRAVIQPGGSIKDDLRTAIQLNSRPKITTIYRHTGWAEINGKKAFLHNGGAITAAGNNPDVSIQLPHELRNYKIKTSTNKKEIIEAVRASLELTAVGPGRVTWPLLAATYAPLYGPVDFAVHLTGRTGTFKSELTSLFQSHYGHAMDARHLPGSWSSTANAIEAQAYYAKNCVFVIDDFIPTGTSWQQRAYQTNADKIMRSQGNQSGRARLTDTSNLQSAMFPRGLCMSTGEDTPEGHSVRARMLIMELSPGEIESKKLSIAQKNREKFQVSVGAFIQYLAANDLDIKPTVNAIRDENIGIGHTRTPAMIGYLCASITYFIEWAQKVGAIKKEEAAKYKKEAIEGIMESARLQPMFLETSDPTDQFVIALRQSLATGLGHLRTINGGVPRGATSFGWTRESDPHSEMDLYKCMGKCIGWINFDEAEVYLDVNIGFPEVMKIAGKEITLSKQTLMKRLKEAGVITRIDDARQRNTVRVTAERHPRQVIALALGKILESNEVPNERTDAGNDRDTRDDAGDANAADVTWGVEE
jgi:hypothetical protein